MKKNLIFIKKHNALNNHKIFALLLVWMILVDVFVAVTRCQGAYRMLSRD